VKNFPQQEGNKHIGLRPYGITQNTFGIGLSGKNNIQRGNRLEMLSLHKIRLRWLNLKNTIWN